MIDEQDLETRLRNLEQEKNALEKGSRWRIPKPTLKPDLPFRSGKRLAATGSTARFQPPSSPPALWQLFEGVPRGRYGLKPYRLYRQRLTTVMLRVPKRFIDQVLWPEFQELNAALMQYLNEVTRVCCPWLAMRALLLQGTPWTRLAYNSSRWPTSS